MTATMSFVLSGSGGTLAAHGVHTPYPDIAAGQAALRSGSVPILMGALPFDVSKPAALMVPQSHRFSDELPSWPVTPLPKMRIAATVPPAEAHGDRIRRALAVLRDPDSALHKVVLARALAVSSDAPIDVATVLSRLAAADPHAYCYLADLTPAGPDYARQTLIGASPELLVARHGERVTCRPFAGSAPRSPDPHTDQANRAALAASAKNRVEHSLVVDQMCKALDPLCVDLQIAPTPQLASTAALWHLSTPINARLRESSTTALDLALALHPTAAVGGVPTDAATAMIAELEGDRGFYAGAAGWCDTDGDGRWVVSIRCAVLSADRRDAYAYSGGGIVADSDVGDEIDETTTKFRTVLAALGAAS
jgi:isochorismate synthase